MINIGNCSIGPDEPVFIIAEAGVNHNGNLDLAKKLIEEAAKAGANAIKFQTYKAEKLTTKNAPRFWDWTGELKKEGSQYDSYSKLDQLHLESYYEMFEHAKKNKIEFLSTPFDNEAVDFLADLGVPAFKVASCDVTNLPLLRNMAKKKLPIFLSTGTSNLGDIEDAIRAIKEKGNDKIILLHCTLSYPTKPQDVNLRMMETMKTAFPEYPVGLSDHTLGIHIPIAAAALGARAIEKHYTVDKTLPLSADHWLSVDPKELAELVKGVNEVTMAFGSPIKEPIKAEEATYKYARRSIVAAREIKKGETLDENMLTCKRPGTGISPKLYEVFIGKKAQRDIPEDKLLEWEDILYP